LCTLTLKPSKKRLAGVDYSAINQMVWFIFIFIY
jgi:hypothetical protein